jgi:MOSC domain-containing protein YiiM
MKLLALSVGEPRQVEWRGERVLTSIFKDRVAGVRRVAGINIEGDRQSDLSVHGGRYKAVYAYPSEHYPFWRHELSEPDLAFGGFGENLTTEGLTEHDVYVGDRFRIGTVELSVTQPRQPCFKLGIRRNRLDIVPLFARSGRSGFYFSIEREGELQEGDTIELIAGDERKFSVAAAFQLMFSDHPDVALLKIAAEHPSMAPSWRDYFTERLERAGRG